MERERLRRKRLAGTGKGGSRRPLAREKQRSLEALVRGEQKPGAPEPPPVPEAKAGLQNRADQLLNLPARAEA